MQNESQKQPQQAAAQALPAQPKWGANFVADMVKRGASEIAQGVGMPGHDFYGHGVQGHDMGRGR